MHPRVFVSSVMEGFGEYRDAARQGIIAAGGEAVLVEDYPALPLAPRSACLDGVASSDIVVVIVGQRGGWTTPSGQLVVEEEYEEARRRRLPVLAFLQEIERDADAQRLAGKLSDYIDGLFRPTFRTPAELRIAVERALVSLIQHARHPKRNSAVIMEHLRNPYPVPQEATVRLVIAPQREEEVVDPVTLGSPELRRELLETAHAGNVDLFSYERPKSTEIKIDSIVILQSGRDTPDVGVDEVRLEVTTGGVIVIDANVTGRTARNRGLDLTRSLVVLEEDVARRLHQALAFVQAFWTRRDPYRRHDPFTYNVAIAGLGYRMLVADLPRGSGIPMGMHDHGVVIAFDRPRPITRGELADPQAHSGAAMTMFRRRLQR